MRKVSLATAVTALLGGLAVGVLTGLVAGAMAGASVGRSRAADEYEARLNTLQDENAVLEAKVTDLEADLAEAREATELRLPGGFEVPRSLDDLRGLFQRPFLGITFEAYDAETHGERPGVKDGVYVAAVDPDSGAERAGLIPGDVIVAVDAAPVHEPADLTEGIAVHDVGDTVVLAIVRSGTRETRDVVLGGRPLGIGGR